MRKLLPTLLIMGSIFALAILGQACGDTLEEAGGRTFDLEHIETTATLARDGSMEVVERVTYDFNGEFSVGTRSFELPPAGFDYEITDIEATEDGEPRLTVTNTPTLYEWNLGRPGQRVSGTHTYELRYTVERAAIVHTDVAELYWNWIGTTSPEVERLDVRIEVPGSGEGVRFWAHGPLNGEVDREGNVVVLEVEDVPANQFVDSRILVPARRFTVEPVPPPVEDEIVAEEEALAAKANELRREAEEQADFERALRAFFTVFTPIVVVLGWLAFFVVWRKWGKEPPAPPDIGDYWRDVPDDPPAIGVALVDWGTVSPTAYAATVVDLAQRGYLTITEQPGEGGLFGSTTDYLFDWSGKDTGDLLPFERNLLDTLFRGQDQVTQKAFTAWARANQTRSAKFWSKFQADVGTDLRKRKYISGNRATPYVIHGLTVAAVAACGVFALLADALVVGGIAIAAAVGLLCVSPLLRQRTDVGGRRFAEWNGLKRFLQDFSRLDEAVSGDMVIYERYLVAAVALGVADQLMEGLRVKVPQVVEQPGFAPWYVGHTVGGVGRMGSMASLGSFASNFGAKATSSFTPPAKSSSGSGFSGGGFSSGGGGGGGGGGFGAR
jgi:uncharacterized membrane protein